MKKFVLTLIVLFLMVIPAHAEGVNRAVAIKTDEGVFLSWPMEEDGKEYTIYRNGEAIATTTVTNYTDAGGDGTGEYKINDTQVSVWSSQYLEVPVSVPQPYEVTIPDLQRVVMTPENGGDIALGTEWTLYPYGNGYTVFINDEGICLDVVDWKIDVGSVLGVYAYNNGNNQRFMIEEEKNACYLKGEQSGLYLRVDDEGTIMLSEKENATRFIMRDAEREMTEAVRKTVYNALLPATYSPGDASLGDLDGDGEWEIVLKWDPSNARDAASGGKTGRVFIDAYELDGTLMWRIDLGVNIRAGAHDTQFLVYDFDGDGKSEVSFRISDGTIDGEGNVIGDGEKDWRDGNGRNLEGPLWVAVFEGATGKLLAKCDFDPQNVGRATFESFGDGYGNRSERYNACVAYLDGVTPHLVFQRGYYARTVVSAYTYKNGEIKKVWRFDTADEGMGQYGGNGNHNISVADADNDGYDEIFLGSLTLDHDGSVLWCGFEGHGDAMHLGDFDPDNEGLEFFSVHEGGQFGYTIHDAATGEKIFDIPGAKDTGRGMIACVGPFGGNYIVNVGSGARRINSLGEDVTVGDYGSCFRVYWDGDLYEELLGGTTVSDYAADGSRVTLIDTWNDGASAINGTKSTPCLSVDMFGDWREEIIWKTQENTALRIYTTTIPTEFSLPPLMTDHVYRMGIVWQNSSYNQPPHLSYYPESGLRLWIGSDKADINGMELAIDSAPYIENDRTMVPLRFIAEMFDFDVFYDNGKVIISKNNSVFETVIGTRIYTMNGLEKEMDAESVIVNDRTMVPVRVIAEAFGMNVDWNNEERMVTVTRGRAKEDFVTVFVVGKGNEAEIGEMLKYFFDETVAIKAVGSIEEISGEEGDYVVVYSDADASVLKDMGIAVINATDVQISEDMTNHEKFKCAEEIAKQMCHTIDATSRKIDGYSQMASFTGEKTFDVDIWGDTACYRVTLVGNATVDINNETYLTWEMEDSLVTYVGAVDGKISVKSQGNVNVTIEPWDSVETEKFEAPTDMELTNTVAGIERYENETRVTIYNTNTEAKKVRIGNSIVTVLPKSAITYEKKVW
ncbi:MAG: hypothetical protein IJ435_03470 [Clostridia bacterium]|nr:hypothetical protein [Clostridia bacterium]